MGRLLTLALMQAPPRQAETALSEFAKEVNGLAANFPQTEMIVYPEYHVCGVAGETPEERNAQFETLAEPLDGPRVRRLAEVARSVGRWLLPGTVIERGPNGELFNTAVVFSPQGELVATYRKMFPWRPFETWTPGRDFTVFDIPDVGRFGLTICYDAWFPEVFRSLTWMGAEVILNPSQTTTCDRAQERILARANAIVNQVYVVTVNSAWPVGTGRSAVIDPEGLVRTEADGETPTLLTDCIDLDQVSRVRRVGTCALNRPWSQFTDADGPIDLPIYGGHLDPATWSPRSGDHHGRDTASSSH
ncbi:MAG: carbon-nitrogen hydrolase family protein [Thermoleophilia bacterium]